jgi:hypothetical protein
MTTMMTMSTTTTDLQCNRERKLPGAPPGNGRGHSYLLIHPGNNNSSKP